MTMHCVQMAVLSRVRDSNTESSKGYQHVLAEADPGFFLGGGALVSCSTSTPINHICIYIFLHYTSCIRKPQVISGGGVRTPCTLPLDPPLIRELQQQRRRRLRECHLKSEVTLLQTLLRFSSSNHVQAWQFFRELNSKDGSEIEKESRPLEFKSTTKLEIRNFYVVVVQ